MPAKPKLPRTDRKAAEEDGEEGLGPPTNAKRMGGKRSYHWQGINELGWGRRNNGTTADRRCRVIKGNVASTLSNQGGR